MSRLNYSQAQQAIDAKTGAGAADGTLALLAEVGRLRQALEVERGAVSLRLPEQEVDADGAGLSVALPRSAAGRGLERADLTADRHGGCGAHARRGRRHPAHAAAT